MQTQKKKSIGKVTEFSKGIEGKYANYFEIGHNAFEFVLDFGQYYPGTEKAELCTRIITCPEYAKAFLATLLESIREYEEQFKKIKNGD
jgi:hypothetical protein